MARPDPEKDLGIQPLDAIMTGLNLSNTDIVKAIPEQQISHKMVKRGREGRRLSINIQNKILKSFNSLNPEKKYSLNDLFNY